MSLNHYANRRDANEPEIVKALRAIGCSVDYGKWVDLIVGRQGMTFLLEVKDGSKPKSDRKLTPAQEKILAGWKGHYAVVTNVDEALAAVQPLIYKGIPVKWNSLPTPEHEFAGTVEIRKP